MKTRIITSLLCMTLCGSCDKHDISPGPNGTRAEVIPTAGVGISAVPAGKATLPDGPVTGTSFPKNTDNLFAVTAYKGAEAPAAGYGNAYFDNKTVRSDGEGVLKFMQPQYYPVDDGKLYFYAYSPAVAGDGYTAGTADATPTVTWNINGRQDIMYASHTTGIAKAEPGAEQQQPKFKFDHLLKQIRFKLVQGEGFGDNLYADFIRIKDANTKVTLDLISGTASFSEGTLTDFELRSDNPASGDFDIKKEESAKPLTAVLMCEPVAQFDMEVSVLGVIYPAKVDLGNTIPGQSHLVTLTFGGTQIVPVCTIEKWDDVGIVGDEID